jgi:hypothetical protein
MAETVKVEIGLVGGGTTSAALDAAALKALKKGFGAGDADLLELETDGGTLFVRPNQVAFLRVQQKESRVGF